MAVAQPSVERFQELDMSKSLGAYAFPAAVVLVGINLRPTMATIGPLLDVIQRETGLSDTGASLLTTLPVALMGVCMLGASRLQAALGARRGIASGVLLIVLTCLGRSAWSGPTALLATAIAGGIGIAMVQALMPMAIRHRAGGHTATVMGIYSTAIMGGAMISSAASPWLAQGMTWTAALGVWVFPALVGLAAWCLATSQPDALPVHAVRRPVHRKRRGWLLLGFFGLGTGAYTLVLAWLPPFYTQLGWSPEAAGALLGALTCAEVAAGIAVSAVVGRTPDRRVVLLLAIGALLAGMLGFSLAPAALAWPAALLAGLGIGALFPLSLIVAMDHGDNPADAGAIVGFVQGGGYLLAAILPLAAGLLREHLSNLAPAWWSMAALCLVLALIAMSLRPGHRISMQG
jgi:CP family cyanate transporter-like MFS transporter